MISSSSPSSLLFPMASDEAWKRRDGEEEEVELRGTAPPLHGTAAKKAAQGRGTWKHAAFHVATTIATPAAYAPLPFALASLGWPFGIHSLFRSFFLLSLPFYSCFTCPALVEGFITCVEFRVCI